MSLVRFRSQNHPQQLLVRGAADHIDDRATDPEFFAPLDAEYRFTIDVAAAAHNTKCERYYDLASDGLVQPWAGERVWCNPPYSNIRPWVERAWAAGAELVVMLVPANRTEQGWWQDLIEPRRDRPGGVRCLFLRGRLRFIRANRYEIGPNERPPFGCCLLVWGT